MLVYKQGNIFTSRAQVIVNTVNCSGVMGAGIALELKLRYPEMFEIYAQQCQNKTLSVGKLAKYTDSEKRFNFEYVLNFPTKNHWKFPSTMNMLEQGLAKFVASYEQCGFSSVAFPLLGVGKGGLDSEQVKALMEQYLSGLPIDIEIWEYQSEAEDDLIARFRHEAQTLSEHELAAKWQVSGKILNKLLQGLSSNKYTSLIQLASISGVGESTMLKLYAYAAQKPEQQESLF